MNSNQLPDNILRRMEKKSRPAGNAGLTTEEANAKYAKGQEKLLQRDCANLLRQRGIWFRQMPFGKKTPWPGWPDFTIFHGTYTLLVECKAEGGTLSKDQEEFYDSLPTFQRQTYQVVFSLNDLIGLLRDFLQPVPTKLPITFSKEVGAVVEVK